MRLSNLIDNHKGLIGTLLVVPPCLPGCVPVTGVVNPLWSSAFGFPIYLAIWAQPHQVYAPHPWTEMFAALVWPWLLLAGMIWAAYKLVRWRGRVRPVLVTIWFLSNLFLIPAENPPPMFLHWPIYALD